MMKKRGQTTSSWWVAELSSSLVLVGDGVVCRRKRRKLRWRVRRGGCRLPKGSGAQLCGAVTGFLLGQLNVRAWAAWRLKALAW